jgi:hypothetical protein
MRLYFSTVEHLETDPSCTYAAVIRPKKNKPLLNVTQNDATYGSKQFMRNESAERKNYSHSYKCPEEDILHNVDSPYACSEPEEVYDDNACMTSSLRKDASNASSELESHSDFSCYFPNQIATEERICQERQTSLRETNSQFYYTLEKCSRREGREDNPI